MVRPPLNCRRMYVGADASIGPQALRQMLSCQFLRNKQRCNDKKVKHFSTRKKSYKKYRNYFGKTLDIKALVW